MTKKLILAAVVGASLAGSLHAQTVINITGATAFRSSATTAINAAFGAAPFAYGFANTDDAGATTNLNNGTHQIWRGTFPGVGANTIIRTSWNGSVEGVRALLQPGVANNASYLTTTAVVAATLTAGGGTPITTTFGTNLQQATADLAFSDAGVASTPLSGSLSGGPVGVIVFTMIANRTWKNDDASATAGISHISDQQFRTLNKLGSVPLGYLKGNTTDLNRVYLTGRNDGSGTRTIALAETGYGASTAVVQYVAHDRSSTTNIPIILKTAAGGGFNFQNVATPTYKSTVWGQDADGNGGYFTGGDIRTDLSKTTNSCAVWEFFDSGDGLGGDPDGIYQSDEDSQVTAPAKLYMLSWLSTGDARSARGSGLSSAATAKVLGYNGVILNNLAGDNPPSTLSTADIGLVANGSYSAWSYENLFHLGTGNGPAVFSQLKTLLNNQTLIGSAGVALGNMNVNRSEDGGIILPGALP